MSILSQVQVGVSQSGARVVIAGNEKVGKTTLACQAPGSLLVPLEMGFAAMSVAKTPMLTTWEQVEALCLELIAGAKAGTVKRNSSIVWDSATALNRIIEDYAVRSDPTYKPGNPTKLNMATAHGGYGKAYGVSTNTFGRWTRYMDELAFHGGVNIIVTCHVFASKAMDPANGEYHQWDLQLHSPKNEKEYGIREFMTQWADLIGFLHEPMFVMKAEDGQKMQRGISANQGRMLAVARSPAWVAGNRYGLNDVIPVPEANGWNYVADAIYKSKGVDVYNRELK